MIARTMAAERCATPAKAIEEAGGCIGRNVKIFGGQSNSTVENNGIRSAIANQADAIVLVAVDCSSLFSSRSAAGAPTPALYLLDAAYDLTSLKLVRTCAARCSGQDRNATDSEARVRR
ncbi:hypothetical protein, partial [Pseudofrankia sp. BMG5.36]|uniref:hypothetical protein n=1 Tax=Pseudofrankia sp. BMG5.36 TaxID=1834512 RepID=UPI001A7E0B85